MATAKPISTTDRLRHHLRARVILGGRSSLAAMSVIRSLVSLFRAVVVNIVELALNVKKVYQYLTNLSNQEN